MNAIDIAAIVLFLVGAVLGFRRGIALEAIHTARLLGCAVAAGFLKAPVRPLLDKLHELPDGPAQALAPWFACFGLLYLFTGGLLALAARRRARRTPGGRMEASILGLVRTALLIPILLVVPVWLGAAPESTSGFRQALVESRTARITRGAVREAPTILLPDGYAPWLDSRLERP